MEFSHRSVLLDETIESLQVKPGGIYVDGTLGGAGHSFEICKRFGPEGRLIGIDQDDEAIEAATEKLRPFQNQVQIFHNNYHSFPFILKEAGIEKVDGILLDLGVSSHQLDDGERGFSYRMDAPLDMRMDKRNELTAEEIVNHYSESEIYRIIRDYGEDPFAKNIAKHIVQHREQAPIRTTFELVEIIKEAIPAKIRMKSGHPAKQTFQAIRIECNQELTVLQESLGNMIDSLKEGGRLSIITFHSLEDRIVKNAFREAQEPCTCPKSFPVCVCGKKSKGFAVTRKPILPSEQEMEQNPRSKSAKLRVFEKRTEK